MIAVPRSTVLLGLAWLAAFVSGTPSSRGATIEYLDGTRLECKVLAKDSTNVTVEVTSGGMLIKRTIPLAKVHRVTINDKTYLINERPVVKDAAPAASPKATNASPSKLQSTASAGTKKATRTRAQVDALINEMGRKAPDWYEATPLNYPQSLDLSWPDGPPAGGWNNQKNVGQFVWDIINPNPGKWREGVRLMHHLLTVHKDDPAKRVKIMNELGRMYANLLEDDARAAFWWRQAGVEKNFSPPGIAVHLAECYWRLGNKQMAVDFLRKMDLVPYDGIKLWADMGETQQALKIAESALQEGSQPYFAYLYAADACRVAGRFPEAISYYEKVLEVAEQGNKAQLDRCRQRATESIEAIKLYDASDVKKIADGTYRGSALGYEGPVHVEVVVQSARLESVRVTQHQEKQFYSAMSDTPSKILAKQSVKGVDATSSATITSEAIINATARALASGTK